MITTYGAKQETMARNLLFGIMEGIPQDEVSSYLEDEYNEQEYYSFGAMRNASVMIDEETDSASVHGVLFNSNTDAGECILRYKGLKELEEAGEAEEAISFECICIASPKEKEIAVPISELGHI